VTFWRFALNPHQPGLPTEFQKRRPRGGERSGTTGLAGKCRNSYETPYTPDNRASARPTEARLTEPIGRPLTPDCRQGPEGQTRTARPPPAPAPPRAVAIPIKRTSWRPVPSCCKQREQGPRRPGQPTSGELLRPDVLDEHPPSHGDVGPGFPWDASHGPRRRV
jgi:hypothetical protein